MYLPPKSSLATLNSDFRIRAYQNLKARLLGTKHGSEVFKTFVKDLNKEDRLVGLIDHLDKPENNTRFDGGWKNELGVKD